MENSSAKIRNASPVNQNSNKKKSLSTHLLAGGGAGFMEAMTCHPLDTIKVRMQLSASARRNYANSATNSLPPPVRLGPLATASKIVKTEGFPALYKGLGPVVTAIVPKMAIRFSSFELFKSWLCSPNGGNTTGSVFVAGLGAGITESILVVTPAEVLKIRLQAQRHSLVDPLDSATSVKYRNTGHAFWIIVREEGIGALYKGVTLTAARQATNQAVNFTVYQKFKEILLSFQPEGSNLPPWQHLVAGGISGGLAPMANAPIDAIKTRLQKSVKRANEGSFAAIKRIATEIYSASGVRGFYAGLTPRLMRIAPGQAITFMVYEAISDALSAKFTAEPETQSDA